MEVGIVGATGLVGRTLLSILESKGYDFHNYHLFASSDKCEQMPYFNREIPISEYNFDKAEKMDVLFACAGSEFSQQELPKLAQAGVVCIDNSSFWRMHDEVPLIVPEINGSLATTSNLISNPNCSTIQLVLALNPLIDMGINEVVVSTYQSVSGAGNEGIKSWQAEVKSTEQESIFERKIHANLIPKIDIWMDLDETREEWKVRNESKKILSHDIQISCHAVRVPVEFSHSEAVRILFEKEFDLDEIKSRLSNTNGIVLTDSRDWSDCLDSAGKEPVFVGRLRKDPSNTKAVWLWIVSDNLYKGAALNAIQIAEKLDGFSQ